MGVDHGGSGVWRLSAFADELGPDPQFQFSTLKRLGIQEIQLRGAWGRNVMDLTREELTELKTLADGHGLGFHAIGSPLGKVDINSSADDTMSGVRRAAEAARIVGAGRVRVFSFYRPPGTSPESTRSRVIDRLADMCEAATEEGVRLVHENEKDIYGDTGARCLDLLENVENLGCCFDFANFVQVGERVWDDCWPILKSRLTYFDIKDAMRSNGEVKPAGEGDGDVERILRDAIESGFSDRFNLEPHLSSAGQLGGSTSADLFELATTSLIHLLNGATTGAQRPG